jgi:DNA-binding GntR family transcriptional regulator
LHASSPSGLVELHDNKGYSVAPISLANLTEITQLRVDFESLALGYAIDHGDLNWESNVMRAVYKVNKSTPLANDVESFDAWERAHREFHLC